MHLGELGVNYEKMSLDNLHKKGCSSKQVDNSRQHSQWSPYEENGGTVLDSDLQNRKYANIIILIGIGGKGFCIMAGDTRLSKGYSVMSRTASKMAKLTDKTFLASSGMYADFVALSKQLSLTLTNYEFNIEKQASTQSIAQLLSNTLYSKRFFPYYCFTLLGGLDEEGNGQVYGYDAIGSGEQRHYQVQGSGQQLIFPVLDNQIQQYNKTHNDDILNDKQKVIDLVVDVFNSAAERDIRTGDSIEIVLIEPSGITIQRFPLRKD